jgi:hypothetical protein
MVSRPDGPARWSLTHQEDPMSNRTASKSTVRSTAVRTVSAAVVATACLASLATPADAKGREVVHRGSCSGASDWKLKVQADDGRLEVEGEVDTPGIGRRWTWRLVHNGSVVAKGTRVTQAPSGSFTVRRLMINRAGTDVITLRARNPRNGERCMGTVRF